MLGSTPGNPSFGPKLEVSLPIDSGSWKHFTKMLPQRLLRLILLQIEVLRWVLRSEAGKLTASLLERLARYATLRCLFLHGTELEDVFSIWGLAGEEFIGPYKRRSDHHRIQNA